MILFIAHRPHQARYFSTLAAALSLPSRVLVLPRYAWPGWRDLACAWAAPLEAQTMLTPQLRKKAARRGPLSRGYAVLYRAALALRARLYHARIARALAGGEVRAIALWNGYGWIGGVARALAEAHRLPVLHFENGLLPGTTTLDPHGVNFRNAVPRNAAFYAALPAPTAWQPPPFAGRTGPVGEATIALPPRYVFVPFQLDSDTQILEFSPWLADMRALYTLLAELEPAARAADLVFVVKEHPSSPLRYPELHQRHDHIRFANGNATQALIQGALGVMTINSTVGLEALLLGRPVLALGQAFYAIAGLAASADGPQAVARWLAEPSPPQPALLARFGHFLTHDYCIPGPWSAPDEAHCAAVEARIRKVLAGQALYPPPPEA